jgi:anti-sigma28 factor (negative regulator of flagellin synthesis)
MEFNTNKKVDLSETRFAEVRRAREMRSAELEETIERVKSRSAADAEALARMQAPTDSIEISVGHGEADEAGRSERISELRAAVEDGSLFNQERLERAATRLLSDRL